MSKITLGDLRTTRKVLIHMRDKLEKDPSKGTTINETSINVIGVMIRFTNDLAAEIRNKK